MTRLAYLTVEYLPHVMSHDQARPARIDGHYADQGMAEGVANLWAEKPLPPGSRIDVCQIVMEAKQPAHWIERDTT